MLLFIIICTIFVLVLCIISKTNEVNCFSKDSTHEIKLASFTLSLHLITAEIIYFFAYLVVLLHNLRILTDSLLIGNWVYYWLYQSLVPKLQLEKSFVPSSVLALTCFKFKVVLTVKTHLSHLITKWLVISFLQIYNYVYVMYWWIIEYVWLLMVMYMLLRIMFILPNSCLVWITSFVKVYWLPLTTLLYSWD